MEELFGDAKWYSRAGRTGAPGIKISVQSKKSSSSAVAGGHLDYSKLVTEEDVEEDDERPREAGEGSTLCSSPRRHPNAVIKRQLAATQEKELHFRNALKSVIGEDEPVVERKIDHVATLREQAAKLRERDFKQVRPHAAFLAVSRDDVVAVKLLQGPPVGHYRPRFHAVEEALHIPKIARRQHSPRSRPQAKSPAAASTPAPVSAGGATSSQHSPGALAAQTSLSETIHTTSLGKTMGAASGVPADSVPQAKCTWPFASRSKGHELQLNQSYSTTPSAPFINTSLVDNFAGSKLTCFMSKHVGRQHSPTTINDLSYDSSPPKAKTPTVYMDRQPPRNHPDHVPRTSANVPRGQVLVDIEAGERMKYPRQPTVSLDKVSPHKNEWLSLRSPLQDTYEHHAVASAVSDMTADPREEAAPAHTIDLRRSSRSAKSTPVLDLVYDVDRSAVDKHVPAAIIKEDLFSKRSQNNSASELRSYSVDLVHKKIVHGVSISGMASREQHSKSGRTSPMHLLEAQHKFYDINTAGEHEARGVPKISLFVSREKRAKVNLPAHQFVDTVYDYSPDAGKKSSSGKANVNFDRVLDREHRAPSRADL
jgi:hypothetical protein